MNTKVQGGEQCKTHRDVGVQLQQGSSDVGCQGHIVTHSSLLETGTQEERSENMQRSVILRHLFNKCFPFQSVSLIWKQLQFGCYKRALCHY